MEFLKQIIGTEKNPIVINFKEYNKRKIVDIRKFYQSSIDSKELLPTKKGIALNPIQLQQLLECLKSNSGEINNFFNTQESINFSNEIEPVIDHTIGRKFEIKFENNKTRLVIDNSLEQKISEEKIGFFSSMILMFHQAMTEVVEDDDEIDLILDSLSNKLNKLK